MNLAWRVQKFRVNFTGRIKTLFTAYACDSQTLVEQFVSHEISAEFFLYFRGDQTLTESNIVCGNITYSGQEDAAEPRSNLSLTIHASPSLIHKSSGGYGVPMFLNGGFYPLDRKQKANSEYVVLNVDSANRDQLTNNSPFWNQGLTVLSLLTETYELDFAFVSQDPESATPAPISCVDPDSGPFESPYFATQILQDIDTFTLTPFYWPYDPQDGGGPIYDTTTGRQLRPFPS